LYIFILLLILHGNGFCDSWSEIAEQAISGSIEAQITMGDRFIAEENFLIAKFWLEKAAKQGDVVAQYNLGLIFHYGLHNGQPNSGQALRWLSIAAEQGLNEAQYAVGEIYRTGYQVPKDAALSLHWLLKAAENENPSAQNTLAVLYYEGRDIAQDFEKAFYWRERAAFNNDEIAQKALIAHYLTGKGTQKDNVAAYAWLLAANYEQDNNLKMIKNALEERLLKRELKLAAEQFRKIEGQLQSAPSELLLQHQPLDLISR